VWEVATRAGDTFRARVLVAGTGGLSRPSFPDIPGRERFAGKTFHTARWDHDYSLAGKRVAVIGTGASAIQVVPSIVSQVGELTLFQRTPPWVLPKPDFRIGKRQQRRLARFPSLQTGVRNVIYWLMESRALGFTNMLPSMQVRTEKTAREFIESQVKDPALRAKLTPDYRIGCKRILMSNEYYAALQAPNASVVTEGIAEIREHGIVTKDGREHPVDVIVYATGFQAAEAVSPFEIRGLGGLDLNENWRSGAEAYKGTTVSGFPNFFMLMGPNTGLGHNSMVFMIESQIQYVMDSLRQKRERNLAWVDVKPSVQARFNRRLQARMSRSVWATGGCVSWYHTATGKNTTLWPGFTFEFRYRTRQFDLQNYRAEQVKARPAETQLQPTAAVPAE
jgi:cation diffusion facilitator CzcD-associated flavoprotein CzcO